jgi:carbamoyl-phosphate synthase large subunit
MRSTGEVMGIAPTFGEAFFKAQLGAGSKLKTSGLVFISVRDNDKRLLIPIAAELEALGYALAATNGTGQVLQRNGIACRILNKVQQGGDTVLEHLKQLAFVINTPNHKGARSDEGRIRSACAMAGVPCFTTLASAGVLIGAIRQQQRQDFQVRPLQELLPDRGAWRPKAAVG